MIHIYREVDLNYKEGFNPVFSRIPKGTSLEDYVFFDIETTGFDPEFSRLAMSAFFYFIDNKWVMEQFLTESREDEKKVIAETLNALMYFKKIVTYNGNDFDIPFVVQKAKKIDVDASSLREKSLDLYPLTKKLKKKYGFVNCKLKTIEKFLGINRTFFIEGEMLASYYSRAIEGSQTHFDEYVGYSEEDVIYLAQLMSDFAEDYFEEEVEEDENAQLELF